MKKLFMFAIALLALTACGDNKKYDVLCMTLAGPIQTQATASEIKGFSNSQATTYTISLGNGAEITVGKGQCLIGYGGDEKAAQ